MTEIKRRKIFFTYTIIVFAIALTAWALAIRNGYTPLMKPDGVIQHIASYRFVVQHTRDLFAGLAGGGPASLFSFSLGQGEDLLITLGTYDFLDPVSRLTALIFSDKIMAGYAAMIGIKFYLSGLCFGLLASERTDEGSAILSGMLLYACSGVSLMILIRHPNFYSGMYCLPLLLWGAERYLREKQMRGYLAAVVLSLLSSYYVSFMNMLLLIGYLVLRLFPAGKRDLRRAAAQFIKALGVGLCGVGLSAVFLFPQIYGFLRCTRQGVATGYTESLLRYPKEFYRALVRCFLTRIEDAGYWTVGGYMLLPAAAFVMLFLFGKRFRRLRIACLILAAGLCIPAFGRLMNGFGYPRNIWSYALALALCMACVRVFPEVMKRKWPVGVRVRQCLLVGCALLCAAGNFRSLRDRLGENYPADKAREKLAHSAYDRAIATIRDDTFYRIEKDDLSQNQEAAGGYRGTTFFWSIMPGAYTDFCDDLRLNALAQNCNWKGLDSRAELMELASVKYCAVSEENVAMVPQNYVPEPVKTDPDGSGIVICRNPDALPIGYCFDGYLDRAAYEQCGPIGKQQALLRGALLEKEPEGLEKIDALPSPEEVPIEIASHKDLKTDGDLIEAEEDGSLTISFNAEEGKRYSLVLSGMETIKGNSSTDLFVTSNHMTKTGRLFTEENNWPVLRDEITFDLGNRYADGRSECELRFGQGGRFRIDRIRLLESDPEEYRRAVDQLKTCVLEDVEVRNGRVSGRISCSGKKLLQMSIPYSKGWSAEVDKEKSEILRSDHMYMALVLEEGDHEITFRYRTPYLREGLIVSLGVLAFLLIAKKRN